MSDWYTDAYNRDTFGARAFPLESRTPGLKEHIASGASILSFVRHAPLTSFDAVRREVGAEITAIGYDGRGLK